MSTSCLCTHLHTRETHTKTNNKSMKENWLFPLAPEGRGQLVLFTAKSPVSCTEPFYSRYLKKHFLDELIILKDYYGDEAG